MNSEGGPFYRFLLAICRVIERINGVLGFVGTLIIAIIAVSTLFDALGRYIARPFHGIHEASELMLLFSTFLVYGAVQYTRSHVDVEIFFHHFSERYQRLVDTLTLLICFLMCLAATYGSTLQMMKSWARMERDAGYVRFPLYPSKTVIVIGLVYLSIVILVQLTGRISEYFGVPSIQRKAEGTISTDDKTAI